ncbi:NTP transferase domain-containing protein [Thalassospira sp.]|uniref:cytidylyltransferase domain-containing protein n=2 Tax=Thalassospira sp. TaxID=1912094 RepID=UPI0032EF7A4B
MKKRIFGLVQARMGSSRLPGKVMKPLLGNPLVGHIFDRLGMLQGLEGIILATTSDRRNYPLVKYAMERGVVVHQETAEDDITGRLYHAAHASGADAILKVNADCPLVDIRIMQDLLNKFFDQPDIHYVSNKIEWTWPEGMSAEVIATSALSWCDDHLKNAVDRELVCNWIRDHKDKFSQLSVVSPFNWYTQLPSLAVDTPDDFVLVEKLLKLHGNRGEALAFEAIPALLKRMNSKNHE